MTNKAVEEAQQNIIGGKPVKEWIDAPFGAFSKAVRETGVDPKFGLDDPLEGESPKKYVVTFGYRYSGRGSKTYYVEARSEEEAEDVAGKEFDKDVDGGCLDFDDAEVDDTETECIDQVSKE